MFDTIWQIITSIVCLYVILGSIRLYRVPRIGAYAMLIALSALVTLVFDLIVILVKPPESHEWSSAVRLFSYVMLAVGVNRMSRAPHHG